MMLFKRDSVMVQRKYVLTQRIAEALHSETAFVASINKISLQEISLGIQEIVALWINI